MRSKLFAALLLVLASPLALALQSVEAPRTFREAKDIAWKIYAERPVDFYCGCKYEGNRIDLKSCGYSVRKDANRAGRVEWEHVVPAWVIGHQRQCWQKGGRDNCTDNDPAFAAAEADLHNLVPSVGEVNGDRSNFALGMVTDKPTQYGQCQMVVNFKEKTAMPPVEARGPAARIYLYMADRYKLRLSSQDRRTYEAWNKMYPVNEWEQWRNQKTACAMGWANPYIGPVDFSRCQSAMSQKAAPIKTSAQATNSSSVYSCSTRKTCGQMSSCEEAKHHLNECENGRLDQDGDGVPCESLCR
ncbi:DNA-specific endonuclease I [Azotobacter chroococcum NCIMB 8003]|uniref:DNA-specific endonuclease I n=2 Tax=Azotobacter chroococcum TaxID=353 RepID=A0A0C4WM77_9GAMM|nr:DNA-specific endonuclease I [Azotobacter chroococcum NCIMB 8003]